MLIVKAGAREIMGHFGVRGRSGDGARGQWVSAACVHLLRTQHDRAQPQATHPIHRGRYADRLGWARTQRPELGARLIAQFRQIVIPQAAEGEGTTPTLRLGCGHTCNIRQERANGGSLEAKQRPNRGQTKAKQRPNRGQIEAKQRLKGGAYLPPPAHRLAKA